ncbi:MAG: amidohydrolase family protein [Candidatus Heimdallarchaeota archaeon]|nr:amidohydrolase family protein [Candidatus Heimdallarchaeota archaeon]
MKNKNSSESKMEILPAGIDLHVHFRDPGFPNKETMATGMRAAHFGGISAVVDMPNTNPPSDTIANVDHKIKLANNYPGIIIAGGLTDRSVQSGEAIKIAKKTRILKVFLAESTGNMIISESNLNRGLALIEDLSTLIMFHAEKSEMIKPRTIESKELDVRPIEAEIESIKFLLDLAPKYPNLKFHVTHVSTLEGAKILSRQNEVSWDVLAKYLHFSTKLVDKIGNFAKMNPPLRTKLDVEGLQKLLIANKIPIITSDHAPHTISEKTSNTQIIAGAPGVQETYPYLLHLYNSKIISKNVLINVIHDNPLKLLKSVGISPLTGHITHDPAGSFRLASEEIQSKCGWSLWQDFVFKGKIVDMTLN